MGIVLSWEMVALSLGHTERYEMTEKASGFTGNPRPLQPLQEAYSLVSWLAGSERANI